MKETLTLAIPLMVNGESLNKLHYDIEAITVEDFVAASRRAAGSVSAIQPIPTLDTTLHIELAKSAILRGENRAGGSLVSVEDLDRLRGGVDVMKMVEIGRNFTTAGVEEELESETSDVLSEDTPENSTPELMSSTECDSLTF
jgi:hypothetical protein